jgi:TolB protein
VGRGRLAVVDADGVLSTVDPSGGSQVTYPVPGVRFGFPAWSPDGTRIAAVGQSATDLAIDVFEVGTGGKAAPADRSPTVIYRSAEHPPFYLYWTPDRQHITFLSTEGDSIALRVAPADGSAPLDGSAPGSIIRRGAPLYFDWLAPDRLLLHVGLGADAFLGEVGAAGAPVRPALPGTGSFRPASVSRDGRYVAYAESGGAGPDQVVVAARDGSTSHRVPVFGPAAMTFDPTGDRLAIIGAVARSATNAGLPIGPLRLLEPASGSVRTLLDASVVAFFWAPDGRTIAAIEPSRPGDQPSTTGTDALAPIGTGVLAAVTQPEPPPGRMVAIAGSLARLVFVDAASGVVRSEQVVRLANDLVDFLLPYFDQYALSHRLWSPDGRALVLPLVGADGDGRLVVIPADGSASHVAAEGIKGFWSP